MAVSTFTLRKSNELVCCGWPENRGSPEVRKVSKPAKNDFNRFEKLHSKTRKRALDSDEELQKEQLTVLEKGINVVQNKTKKYWLGTGKKERKGLKDSMLAL